MGLTLIRLFSVQAMAGCLACIMLGIGVPAIAVDLPMKPKSPIRTPSTAPANASTPPPGAVTTTVLLASTAPTLQTCKGPQRLIAPQEIFNLTCNVVSPLGGSKMLILPEVWIPGNGCIVTVDKPRVVMVGNNFGVTATFTNRCASGMMGSEGGLSWLIYQMQ